jgi:hypothetical protein
MVKLMMVLRKALSVSALVQFWLENSPPLFRCMHMNPSRFIRNPTSLPHFAAATHHQCHTTVLYTRLFAMHTGILDIE